MSHLLRLTTTESIRATPVFRCGSGLCRILTAGLRMVQYGRLVSLLYQVPDEYLERAGLRRADIPEHARRLVYGDE